MKENFKKSFLKNKINLVSFCVLLFIFIPFVYSYAAGLTNPLKYKDLGPLISMVLGYVVKIGGIIAVFAIVYTGYLFAFARGNSGKLDNARSALLNTVIGLVILLGAQLIASMITTTIGGIK
jgi:type IV secretory pathway VirB2 component (pilin)